MRFSLFSDFPKSCKINRLQTKKDSIPIAIRAGPAISPHPPQPPAATFKRLYRTRAEHLAQLHAFVKRASDRAGTKITALVRGSLVGESVGRSDSRGAGLAGGI